MTPWRPVPSMRTTTSCSPAAIKAPGLCQCAQPARRRLCRPFSPFCCQRVKFTCCSLTTSASPGQWWLICCASAATLVSGFKPSGGVWRLPTAPALQNTASGGTDGQHVWRDPAIGGWLLPRRRRRRRRRRRSVLPPSGSVFLSPMPCPHLHHLCAVTSAGDGMEALQLLRSSAPDTFQLVLTVGCRHRRGRAGGRRHPQSRNWGSHSPSERVPCFDSLACCRTCACLS